MSVEVPALRLDAPQLAPYRALCGFADPGLPVTFPQVLASGLQIHLLTRREFPLRLLGMVHVRNVIRALQPLEAMEPYRVQVEVIETLPVQAGVEFAVATRYYAHDTLAWESIATALCRTKDHVRRPTRTTHPPDPVEQLEAHATLDVPADIGRRYGRVSGDMNPIHLCWLGGRLFGFPRHIAHGMWSLARCLALLADELPEPPFEIAVEFKQALLLPSRVSLLRTRGIDPVTFALMAYDRARLHLVGSIRRR